MNYSSFIDYALSEELSSDAKYTVELLIDHVRSKFETESWDAQLARSDARERPDYEPSFLPEDAKKAADVLMTVKWISLQHIRGNARPVRDLTPLRYLCGLTGLSLGQNQIVDLSPLRHCRRLRRLFLADNRIRSLDPIAECKELVELELRNNPIDDFEPLERLPSLRELTIEGSQIATLKKIRVLPALTKLELGTAAFDSFEGFPNMPELKVIWGATIQSLSGIEKFPTLENLVNISGEFTSLEPLRSLQFMTHINLLDSKICSLDPLSGLLRMRDLWVTTDAPTIDLKPIDGLPALHDVTVKCGDDEPPELDKLRDDLTSWDVEFFSVQARHTPSLELEVVDQATFDHFNGVEKFGITRADSNLQLLSSERDWIDTKIEEVFGVEFESDEDYVIPYLSSGARSLTVMLLSEKAMDAFSRLVLGIQKVIAHSRHDWIVYFQSDGPEFIVWIYPEKIVTTPEYESQVRRLIEPCR